MSKKVHKNCNYKNRYGKSRKFNIQKYAEMKRKEKRMERKWNEGPYAYELQ